MIAPVPKVGDIVKVFLPGESPWAECIAVYEDGTWQGRIDNYLFAQMTDEERGAVTDDQWGTRAPLPRLHSFRQNQVVRFKMVTTPDYSNWMPAEPEGGRA